MNLPIELINIIGNYYQHTSDDMNYKRWFDEKPVITPTTNYWYYDKEVYDSWIFDINKKKYRQNVVDDYFNTILEDTSGKYFFISKRRVKWFLLRKVHLDDCRLTYKSLWDTNIKTRLLEELAELSSKLTITEIDLECWLEEHPNSRIITQTEYIQNLKDTNIDNYRNGIREELDIIDTDSMSDESAIQLLMYAYRGERITKRNIIGGYVDTLSIRSHKYKEPGYIMHELVDEFTLKIILYSEILLQTRGETFSSFSDSSPMSDLNETVCEYLDQQYQDVKRVLGVDRANRLAQKRCRLKQYSHTILTMFQMYRMFHSL